VNIANPSRCPGGRLSPCWRFLLTSWRDARPSFKSAWVNDHHRNPPTILYHDAPPSAMIGRSQPAFAAAGARARLHKGFPDPSSRRFGSSNRSGGVPWIVIRCCQRDGLLPLVDTWWLTYTRLRGPLRFLHGSRAIASPANIRAQFNPEILGSGHGPISAVLPRASNRRACPGASASFRKRATEA